MSLLDTVAEVLAYTESPPPNEAATCLWVIYPILRALGYAPLEIQPEGSDNNSQYPDYTILPGNPACWYLEAKAWNVKLQDSHAHQSLNYANHNGRRWVVLTNGQVWRLYDNQVQGVAADKLVVEARLNDVSAIEEFLSSIGRASVTAGRLDRYAKRTRLVQLFRIQLADANSTAITALWNAVRKEPGLSEVSRADVVQSIQALGHSSESAGPSTNGAADVEPAVPPAASNKDADSAPEAPPAGYSLDALPTSCVTARKPTSLLLPDGQERAVKNWRAVAVEVISWLGANRALPERPFRGGRGGKRYFLNSSPDHQTEPMITHAAIEAGGSTVYVDVHRSGLDIVSHLCDVCKAVGVDAALFRVTVK
ncbi:MAG TPA: hypothetical protein VK689_19785 [Armatimonadota bacterium]|nr:hypothetical protein [Armatimonadota bacterium]